jgi:HSP20 family protein
MAEREIRTPARIDPYEEDPLWEPFRLSRLLEPAWTRRLARAEAFVPAVDVAEDDKKYVISVEVPGASKDDVTLEVHENVLTIRGEKRSEREEKKQQTRYVERSYGAFSRSFTLPSDADADQVHADFKNGVLTIEIPKSEAAKPRTISIR